MTVSSDVNQVSYVGSGTTGPFTIPFYFLEDDDLTVIQKTIADGTEVTLVLNTDYTVTGALDEAGGELTLAVALSALYELHIIRTPDVLQLIRFLRNDKFPNKSNERGLDKLTMLIQRMVGSDSRALKAPLTETADQVFSTTDWADRLSKIVAFDAVGNLTVLDQTQLIALLTGVAPQFFSNTFNGDGADTTFVLSEEPASANATAVYVSGVRQTPGTDYTLAASTITFAVAPPVGVNNILAVWTSVTTISTVPADGSVTTPKLADGALAASAAGLAKMAANFFAASADGLAKFAAGFWQVGGHTKWADGFWAASAAVRAKFADGIWTFAKIDSGALADQAEAEAGASSLKLMTPLRTKQAIDALAGSVNKGAMSVRGADCKNNAGTPNTQYDLDADTIVLRDASNKIVVVHNPGAALTNNVSTAGPAAAGRDQAGAFAADSWIHFYWIYNPTTSTLSTLSSAVAPPTGPTLPTDYTYWAYAGAVRFDAASHLIPTRIKGCWAYYEGRQKFLDDGGGGGVANTERTVSVANYMPPNALLAHVAGDLNNGTGGTFNLRMVSGTNFMAMTGTAAGMFNLIYPVLAQTVIYHFSGGPDAGNGFDGYMLGYKIPNGGE